MSPGQQHRLAPADVFAPHYCGWGMEVPMVHRSVTHSPIASTRIQTLCLCCLLLVLSAALFAARTSSAEESGQAAAAPANATSDEPSAIVKSFRHDATLNDLCFVNA